MTDRWRPRARERVFIYVGKERLRGIVVGAYDAELYPDVYRCQIDRGLAFVDAHRSQLRRVKPKAPGLFHRHGGAHYFIAKFEGPTLTPEGLSLPKASLAEAQALGDRGHKLVGILEVVIVNTHSIQDIPPRPAWLAKGDGKK